MVSILPRVILVEREATAEQLHETVYEHMKPILKEGQQTFKEAFKTSSLREIKAKSQSNQRKDDFSPYMLSFTAVRNEEDPESTCLLCGEKEKTLVPYSAD